MGSLSIKARVADRVADQQPAFIQDEHQNLIKFFEAYYEFMEQNGGPLRIIRDTVDNIDVDNTSEEFLQLIKKNVFPAALSNIDTAIDERELIKSLRDLYLSKGSEESFNFIMQKIYANSAKVDYGKHYVFRTSDNEYLGNVEMIIENLNLDTTDLLQYVGTMIVQYSTAASAIIDDVKLFEASPIRDAIVGDIVTGQNTIQNVVDLKDIRVGDVLGYNEFGSGESHFHYHLGTSLVFPRETRVTNITGSTITTDHPARYSIVGASIGYKTPYYKCTLNKNSVNNKFDHTTNALILDRDQSTVLKEVGVVCSIVDVNITEQGSLYSRNDEVRVFGGSGYDTTIAVDEISTGKVESAKVMIGGTGYAIGDTFAVQSKDGYGKGASITVTGVDGSGAHLRTVLEVSVLTIPTPAPVGYEVGDTITLGVFDRYNTQPEFIVTAVAGGTGLNKNWLINRISVGSGYRPSVKAKVLDAGAIVQTLTYSLDSFGGILIDQITPNTTWTAPTVLIGGAGAYGSITVVGKTVTGFTVTAGGFNYLGEHVIRFFSDVGRTIPLSGNQPTVTYTVNGSGTISAIAVNGYGGYFDVANGTYYFDVVETTGSGASYTLENYKYITAVTPTYGGEFIENPITSERISMTTSGTGQTWIADIEYDIKEVEIVSSGRGYVSPTLTLTGGSVSPPTVNLTTATEYEILRINVVNGGYDYVDATVVISGDGTGATATANISGGVITSVTLTSPGTGYVNATATITSATGSNAILTVDIVEPGGIKSATVV